MRRRTLDTLPRGTDRRSRHNTTKRNRRSNLGGTLCPATGNLPEVGIVECEMRDGHRGNHQDNEGNRWSDEYATY